MQGYECTFIYYIVEEPISTVSTDCGQDYQRGLNKLSTHYPQFVDNIIIHKRYPE